MTNEILDAIVRANKLGAKGIQVVGYGESQSASASKCLVLVTQTPILVTASEKEWYE